jgi:undecaprenyl-diphosphatase
MKSGVNSNDLRLFFLINGHHNTFLDKLMYLFSSTEVWIPVYLFILYTLYKEYRNKSWIFMLSAIMMVIISDKVSTFLKYLMKILRPSHEIYLKPMIHLSKAGPGGLYGYVSSHASNFFSLAIFLIVLLPKKYNGLKIGFLLSAILVAYSRIYNGVHYPLDVARGILLGTAIGLLFAIVLKNNIVNKLEVKNI